jgi:hypothetical protein
VKAPFSQLARYYRSQAVRTRIEEYCGGRSGDPGSLTARDVAGYGGRRRLARSDGAPVATRLEQLPRLWNEGADVCRSLADRGGTLLQLDIDYVNPAAVSEPYLDPAAVFERLEPLYRSTRAAFLGHGVEPVTVMTGRGYHFMLRVPAGTAFHEALAHIGKQAPGLARYYETRWGGALPGAARDGCAHEGAGRLLEHLAHEIIRDQRHRSALPVSLTDAPVVPESPFAVLDLTAYADPLFERHVRCAFSGNQKAWMGGIAPGLPFVLALPRSGEDDLPALLGAREDPEWAAALATHARAAIPDAEGDSLDWIRDYEESRLASFHRELDAGPRVDPEIWPFTYDQLELADLPACVRRPLASPNPALLQPVYLRAVALALWGMGWHPASVAGLVRSRYEKWHAWGDLWRRYEPRSRAEFYVRIICGAAAEGLEFAEDFTCDSQRRRGACDAAGCGHELGRFFPRQDALRTVAEAARPGRRGPKTEAS